jgi:hypothetical protein
VGERSWEKVEKGIGKGITPLLFIIPDTELWVSVEEKMRFVNVRNSVPSTYIYMYSLGA